MKLIAFKTDSGLAICTNKEVDTETIDFLYKWGNLVSDFQSIDSLFRLFLLEIDDYNNYLRHCKSKTIEELSKDSFHIARLNKHVVNITSNGRLAIEHFEVIVKKAYSEFEEEWLTKKRDLHSKNFSYRFVDKLRNYVQHVGFPISSLQQKYDIEEGKEVLNIELIFNPIDLMEKFKSWGTRVKNDLVGKKKQEFTFSGILEEYDRIICLMYSYTLEVFMKTNHEFICSTFQKLFTITSGKRTILYLLDVSQDELVQMEVGNWSNISAKDVVSTDDVKMMMDVLENIGLIKMK